MHDGEMRKRGGCEVAGFVLCLRTGKDRQLNCQL